MGCRRCFVANRLEELVDEGDSRSSSRVRERESFLLVSQLHVESMSMSSHCVNKPGGCSSTFSSASLS